MARSRPLVRFASKKRLKMSVHSFLTPKLQVLRNLRIVLSMNGYSKSFLLRYLEEALAETIAQVTIKGFREVFKGIAFPVKEGYVTIVEMGSEAKGILLGPVVVSGMAMNVYYSYLPPPKSEWQELKR